MIRHATLFVIALVSSIPMLAQSTPPSYGDGPANFCEGRYALCIKAPCTPIVSRDATTGAYSVTEANCICDMEVGWSMGPGACDSRKPTKGSDGNTYVISTYSNFFNSTNLTLTCENKPWAWCYGSPCIVDAKDPSKATCTCPLIPPSTFMTLGGECKQTACNSLWSAAYPKEDAFANNHFYKELTKKGVKPPPNPAAKNCPVKPTAPPAR
ncbi:MAG TPA: hypothetical protein VN181_00185 [Thermoanaerobaculia bacterium]|nr:hypothetical protein [Thermoanaerobaculia bacterium]